MTKQRIIKDPVWGNILLSEDIYKNVIDSKPIQRLRHIRQGGFTFLSIPSANHSRFEHILGTYYLSRKWQEGLGIFPEKLLLLALLHHIDETPFSYATSEVIHQIRKDIWKNEYKRYEKQIRHNNIDRINHQLDVVELTNDLDKIKTYQFYSKESGEKGSLSIDYQILYITSLIDAICRNSHYMGIGRPSSIESISKFLIRQNGDEIGFGMNFLNDIFVKNSLEELKCYAYINAISHVSRGKSRLIGRVISRILYTLFEKNIQINWPLTDTKFNIEQIIAPIDQSEIDLYLELTDGMLLQIIDKLDDCDDLTKFLTFYNSIKFSDNYSVTRINFKKIKHDLVIKFKDGTYKDLIDIESQLTEKLDRIIIIDPLFRSIERGFSVPPISIDQTEITANIGEKSLYRKLLSSNEMQNICFYSLEQIEENEILPLLN